jgi:hypothetical protein
MARRLFALSFVLALTGTAGDAQALEWTSAAACSVEALSPDPAVDPTPIFRLEDGKVSFRPGRGCIIRVVCPVAGIDRLYKASYTYLYIKFRGTDGSTGEHKVSFSLRSIIATGTIGEVRLLTNGTFSSTGTPDSPYPQSAPNTGIHDMHHTFGIPRRSKANVDNRMYWLEVVLQRPISPAPPANALNPTFFGFRLGGP